MTHISSRLARVACFLSLLVLPALPASAQSTLDGFTPTTQGLAGYDDVSDVRQWAYGFDVGEAVITSVDVSVRHYPLLGTQVNDLVVQLRTDSGFGYPSNTVLGSATIPAASISAGGFALATATFSPGITLCGGQHWLVLWAPGAGYREGYELVAYNVGTPGNLSFNDVPAGNPWAYFPKPYDMEHQISGTLDAVCGGPPVLTCSADEQASVSGINYPGWDCAAATANAQSSLTSGHYRTACHQQVGSDLSLPVAEVSVTSCTVDAYGAWITADLCCAPPPALSCPANLQATAGGLHYPGFDCAAATANAQGSLTSGHYRNACHQQVGSNASSPVTEALVTSCVPYGGGVVVSVDVCCESAPPKKDKKDR